MTGAALSVVLTVGLFGCAENSPNAPEQVPDGHGKVIFTTSMSQYFGDYCWIDWGDGTNTKTPLYQKSSSHTYLYNGSYKVVLTCSRGRYESFRWLPIEQKFRYNSRANVNMALEPQSIWGLSIKTITALAALITAIVALLSFLAGRKSKQP